MNEELGVPLNLLELLKRDAPGYALKEFYYLELDHDCMGSFPAIIAGTRHVVAATELALAFDLWQDMPPRISKLRSNSGYVNDELGIVYPMLGSADEEKERSKPLRFLTRARLDELRAANEHPFAWAPGLLGGGTSAREMRRLIEVTARERGVSLAVVSAST